jgi:DHA2 family multidrug resistance protein
MADKWRVLITVVFSLIMLLLDATVVNVALAKLQAVFSIDVATVQWVVTGFALASGISTPLASYAADRLGSKRVWLTGLIVFTSASVLCGLSPSFWLLVAGRAIQGFTSGILIPVAVSQLFAAFPPAERGLALGFFAIPVVAGPALGPTLGGYLVSYADWRLIFFLNLPFGITATALGLLLLRPDAPSPRPALDLPGVILSTLGFGAVLYGLSRTADDGWGAPLVLGSLALGLLALVLFLWHEAGQSDPLLEVRLFAIPRFFLANLVGWVTTVAFFGAEFLLPLYLQNLRGLSAVETGLLLLPQGITAAIVGPLAGRLTDRIGARYVVTVGFLLLALNTWELSHLTATTSLGELRWLLAVRGAAVGCALQPTQLVALAVVPRRRLTSASALTSALRNVVQSFGVALLGTVVQSRTTVHVELLRQQVTPLSPAGRFLDQLAAQLARAGLSTAQAQASALLVVLGQIRLLAAVEAFGDAYRLTFFAALLAAGLSLLLPGRLTPAVGPENAGGRPDIPAP